MFHDGAPRIPGPFGNRGTAAGVGAADLQARCGVNGDAFVLEPLSAAELADRGRPSRSFGILAACASAARA